MSELSGAEITHLAKLARLWLSADETAAFSQELPKIVEFVEQLQTVRLDTEEVTSAATELSKLRSDEVSGERLTMVELEQLAPEWQGGQNVVPAVFGESEHEGQF